MRVNSGPQTSESIAADPPWSSVAASESERQKNLAVVVGHSAMVLLVVVAVTATIITDGRSFSTFSAIELVIAAVLFVAWSFYGAREMLQNHLWRNTPALPAAMTVGTYGGPVLYFAIQLGLVCVMFHAAASARAIDMLWLVLLPPIGHSVILLPRLGTGLISVLCILIAMAWSVWAHGWAPLPEAFVKFSLAVIFTLIFTQIAVSAERSRGEVVRLACELTDANRKLGEYAVQAEELAATRERNRLAREIHDTVGHFLTVVYVQLEAARAMLTQDPANALGAIGKAQTLTQEGLREIRHSVAALRAAPLENRPLQEALRHIVSESRSAGLDTEMTVLGQARVLSPPTALSLYRVVQEGLTNARKHSRAERVELVLDFRPENSVRLSVTDNGQGSGEMKSGFGLLGLRERALILGGELNVRTSPGQGFVLEIEVPG